MAISRHNPPHAQTIVADFEVNLYKFRNWGKTHKMQHLKAAIGQTRKKENQKK